MAERPTILSYRTPRAQQVHGDWIDGFWAASPWVCLVLLGLSHWSDRVPACLLPPVVLPGLISGFVTLLAAGTRLRWRVVGGTGAGLLLIAVLKAIASIYSELD